MASPRGYFWNAPVPYAEAAALQEELVRARIAGRIPDTVLFLEHPPVITLGRRGREDYLKHARSFYRESGIEIVRSTRGGDVTYHAPGQLVMYPILQLSGSASASHGYLGLLEQTAVETARAFGVEAYTREGMAGAWTDAGKIAAIGFRLKHWVSYHGMSFNVRPDLRGFDTIVGCGLEGEAVSSLQAILGEAAPTAPEVRTIMAGIFGRLIRAPFSLEAWTDEGLG
jgi:lipoate-protein ligase B